MSQITVFYTAMEANYIIKFRQTVYYKVRVSVEEIFMTMGDSAEICVECAHIYWSFRERRLFARTADCINLSFEPPSAVKLVR